MEFRNYSDKVYGCWLGKCVCGNIGAPFEGMKQKLSVRFDRSMAEETAPNDDLDLQVLFLDVVERFGPDFTADQLAEAFYRNCPYAPGEYAYFKKNFRCGIHPPLSGSFNNEVYRTGMGCTIRSELWACLAPGDPEKAVNFCLRDGVLDHDGDGLWGEVFLTALESLAFAGGRIPDLIGRAAQFVPGDSPLRRLIGEVLRWAEEDLSFFRIRDLIVSRYGSAEATSVYQNVGFILLGLLRGSRNFLESAIEVCNCGFDTDCTCASFGAVRGILLGGEQLNREYDFSKVTYRLGVTARARSPYIRDLSEEVAALGGRLGGMAGAPETAFSFEQPDSVTFRVSYGDGGPSLAFGESKKVTLWAVSRSAVPLRLRFACDPPLVLDREEAEIGGAGEFGIELTVRVAEEARELPRANLVRVRWGEGKEYVFGFAGAARFEAFGPFWKNNVEVPPLREKESYWNYFPAGSEAEKMDRIRFYHTNCLPREVSPEEALLPEHSLGFFDSRTDAVRVEEHLRFDGQAWYVFRLRLVLPEARTCGLQMGCGGPAELYLNGRYLTGTREHFRYTPENLHCFGVELLEGDNELIFKVMKCGDCTRFSFDFLEEGPCSNHMIEYKFKR